VWASVVWGVEETRPYPHTQPLHIRADPTVIEGTTTLSERPHALVGAGGEGRALRELQHEIVERETAGEAAQADRRPTPVSADCRKSGLDCLNIEVIGLSGKNVP